MRKEVDALGEMELPNEVYYGIQTERARQNFDVSGITHYQAPRYIWAVAAIKMAAARANARVDALEQEIADAICQAAQEVMDGKHADQFPIDMYQGGGGTSTNMNVNEVIGNRANEILTGAKGCDRVHPNTHVNMGQSTNDVIPAAMKVSTWFNLQELLGNMPALISTLQTKVDSYKHIVKLGRTCIQDAVPMTMAQQFSGYLSLAERMHQKISAAAQDCLELPLGATAVGTGLSARDGYLECVYPELQEITGADFKPEHNFFDGLQNGDTYVDIHANLKKLAMGLSKFATDLRIMSSGPRAGMNEVVLPAVQPGSSIMPGKINPVMPELVNQICYQICGNDVAIGMAVEGGELDLNVWEPVIIKNMGESCTLLTNTVKLFNDKCVAGLEINEEVCRKYAEDTTALSTMIAAIYDYPTGSRVAKKAFKEGKSVGAVTLEEGLMTEAQVKEYLDPMLMTDPVASALAVRRARRELGIDG
ncbi:aspartate ammonia-lyase [Parendozoicomonas haliclonae]|uniref:Fumarate hydratase class II n=1 Tax=Parendozoicomonas haliclonae TaxID=1960125 RepID=A0A1X7AKQ0_9GAMM|nr:aspartate ammonia-lyase [Parendozoicomonas haliclonae]SMA48250.1 Fumarate hydratase class II [Parendozoicomonas haliclonae]